MTDERPMCELCGTNPAFLIADGNEDGKTERICGECYMLHLIRIGKAKRIEDDK